MNYLLSEAEVPRDVAPMAEITWTVVGVPVRARAVIGATLRRVFRC